MALSSAHLLCPYIEGSAEQELLQACFFFQECLLSRLLVYLVSRRIIPEFSPSLVSTRMPFLYEKSYNQNY